MRRWFGIPLAAIALAFPLSAQRPLDRAEIGPLLERAAALEIEIQQLLRYAAPDFDPAAARDRLRAIARELGFPSVEVTVPSTPESLTSPSGAEPAFEVFRVGISGRGRWADVAQLFLLAADPARIEELRVSAVSPDTVEFAGTLGFVGFTGFRPSAPPSGDPIADAKAALSDREALLALARELPRASAEGPRALTALDALMTALDPHPVALTMARIGRRRVELEGFLFGSATGARIADALKDASLSDPVIALPEGSECGAFRIVSSVAVPDDLAADPRSVPSLVMGDGIFDHASRSVCTSADQGQRKRIVAGSGTAATTPMVRLRGVELPDVFQVLNDLIADGFVIEPDVHGTIDADFHEDSTIEEILELLAAAGAHATPPPLRIVRARPDPSVLPNADASGPRVTLQFSDIGIASLLCVAADVLGREVWIPAGLQRTVSVFVEHQPIDLVVARLAAASGMAVRTGPERIEWRPLEREKKSSPEVVNACAAAAGHSTPRLVRRVRGVADLRAADLRLAALTHVGGEWTAYAYLPGRRLAKLEAGSLLADGQIIAVGAHGVTVIAGSQRREVALPD